VIPTYKRPDTLTDALEHLARLDYDLSRVEVIVIDNGEESNTASVGNSFADRLSLTYVVNQKNLGPGGSLNRGLTLARGDYIVLMNDDALVPPHFLIACEARLASDPLIVCIGFRAIEVGYTRSGTAVGVITREGTVVGNFDTVLDAPIEVEHVYGFCYVITREAFRRTGLFDTTLLAAPYASGNRIETDQCLSIRRAGLKVLYDPTIAVRHLAKPRTDIAERSLRWRLNDIRNTLYLLLKHYGVFGNHGASLRYGLFHDLGLRSALLWPSISNLAYCLVGLQARASAIVHYLAYLINPPRLPLAHNGTHL
jgi:GT2 family glycosyltransferase